MKRVLMVVLVGVFFLGMGTMITAYGGPGPAPNSGDGTPDGSGLEPVPGPIGAQDPFGPSEFAGDGIPDGSSLPAPNGPA
jgi:hypothetical protein